MSEHILTKKCGHTDIERQIDESYNGCILCDFERMRCKLSLAEKGLASAMQEIQQLQSDYATLEAKRCREVEYGGKLVTEIERLRGEERVPNPCTCKAEHWQPHADTCPAKVDRPLLTLQNIRSGTVPSDAHAVGFLLGEIERLRELLKGANTHLLSVGIFDPVSRAVRAEIEVTTDEPGAVASFPSLSIDPAADEVVDRLVADRLSKKSGAGE